MREITALLFAKPARVRGKGRGGENHPMFFSLSKNNKTSLKEKGQVNK